jgi:pimeloyl-ACP methyl ester carboxylesterase
MLANRRYQWRIDLNVFKASGPSIAAFPDSNKLSAYTGETFFIAGLSSGYVTRDDIALLFPNAIYRTIADAGHWPHVQKPEEFIEMVENFL